VQGIFQATYVDLKRAFNFRRNKEDVDGYEKKIDAIVEKLFQHKWDKQPLKREFLVYCCNDIEIKREIKIRGYKTSQEIAETFGKFDRLREDIEHIDTIRN